MSKAKCVGNSLCLQIEQSFIIFQENSKWSGTIAWGLPWWLSGKESACQCRSSVQFIFSVVSDSATPWTAARQASLSITNSRSLPKLMSIESVMPSNHLILCHSLLFLPSIFPSIRVFSNESTLLIRWPKYWSFRFNISPSNEYLGLISFRMERLDLDSVQRTLKSLFQYHSSKASIILCSALFIVQLSHPYMTTGKTTALTRRTFVDKVMSLLFNMLSRLVITFLPRSKRLLISWLQSPSAGDGGSIPALGRSPGEGNGNQLQYSNLGNPMDRGAWKVTILGATKESGMT